MDNKYKVKIDFEDIKSNETLKKIFSEKDDYELFKKFKRGLLAILGLFIFIAVILFIADKLFSVAGMVYLIVITVGYYITYSLLSLVFIFLYSKVDKRQIKECYKYLLGEFEIILEDKKLIMKSEWKDIILNLEGCRVKNSEKSIVFIEKSGFIVMFPKNKFENFEAFREEILLMRGNRNE